MSAVSDWQYGAVLKTAELGSSDLQLRYADELDEKDKHAPSQADHGRGLQDELAINILKRHHNAQLSLCW